MMKAETYTGVERERERELTLINNKQAKRLALLSIYGASAKHESV